MRKILYTFLIFIILVLSACNKNKDNTNSGFVFKSESKGCCSFIVYKINNEADFIIAVRGNRENLNLSSKEQVYDLRNVNFSDLNVEINKIDPETFDSYCDHVLFSGSRSVLDSWAGKDGTVKIKITDNNDNISESENNSYKINVILENVNLKNNKGGKIFIDYLEFSDVEVGNCPY